MNNKHYFLIKTTDNERSSSYKYIAETYEEAEELILSGKYNCWYCSTKGNGEIVEVDKTFKTIHVYDYWQGKLFEIDYKKVVDKH